LKITILDTILDINIPRYRPINWYIDFDICWIPNPYELYLVIPTLKAINPRHVKNHVKSERNSQIWFCIFSLWDYFKRDRAKSVETGNENMWSIQKFVFWVLATWFFGSKIKLSRREKYILQILISEKYIFSIYQGIFLKNQKSWIPNTIIFRWNMFFANVYLYKTGNENTYDLNVKVWILGPKKSSRKIKIKYFFSILKWSGIVYLRFNKYPYLALIVLLIDV